MSGRGGVYVCMYVCVYREEYGWWCVGGKERKGRGGGQEERGREEVGDARDEATSSPSPSSFYRSFFPFLLLLPLRPPLPPPPRPSLMGLQEVWASRVRRGEPGVLTPVVGSVTATTTTTNSNNSSVRGRLSRVGKMRTASTAFWK